jgi:hypothetical protein
VAWHTKHPTPRWGPVGQVDALSRPDGKTTYRFRYTEGARLVDGFRPFDGMGDLNAVYHSDELFPMLVNRLLPRSRPEYADFLRWCDFGPDDPPKPLALLRVSEGIKVTDAIEVFPCPEPSGPGGYPNRFFIHGMRFQLAKPETSAVVERLRTGDQLTLRCEPDNPIDPFAVAIDYQNVHLGYAPRYLAHEFTRLMRDCPTGSVQLFVQKLNPDAPFQQRVLCRMNACWPEDFRPCSGPEFALISETNRSVAAAT